MKSASVVARRIADGIQSELFAGRIRIDNGVISAVEKGDFLPEAGEIFIDENKVLAPAFIDAHGHSDISLMAMPQAEGKVFQGIAYEISGNCGLSPFPLTAHNREHLQKLYKEYGITLDWSDITTYLQKLRSLAPKLELFPLVGHNTLRAAVAGYEKKKLDKYELAEMFALLDRELAAGALGLSFGLLYTPGCFADHEEISGLMKVVAKHQKICTVHLKSEGNDLENALQTMLDAARAAGLKKLHLSHLKTAGKQNFHKLPVILDALASSDIRVTGDIYCYDAGMSQLSIILPAPYDEYDDITISRLLADDKTFEKVLQQVDRDRQLDYWRNIRIISAAGAYKQYEQLLMHEAAERAKLPPSRLFLEILRCDSAAARAAFHTLSLENMRLLAGHKSVVPGSDESARNRTFAFGSSHPRGFGNHAEYFNLRRSQNAAIGEIISEMSMNIAAIFNIPGIGAINCGNRAVFAVIDPEFYRAQSTFMNPHQLCRGAEILNLQEV